jgi:hypothetical protein
VVKVSVMRGGRCGRDFILSCCVGREYGGERVSLPRKILKIKTPNAAFWQYFCANLLIKNCM